LRVEHTQRRLMASQIADAVGRAVARLQPDLAEPLMLYEVEGKTYSQIAEMLGIPVGTVRTRIFRAREFIAKRLEPVLGSQRRREVVSMSLAISKLLNGQLDSTETRQALDSLTDPALRDRYTVYGLIGDVLRGNSTPDDGFSVRIFERISRDGVSTEDGYDPLQNSMG
jgi:hypothetical protein